MEKGDKFIVYLGKHKIDTECYYSSDQVLLFRLAVKWKELKIEKRIFPLRQRQPWRILTPLQEINEHALDYNLQSIKLQIDIAIQGPQEPYIHPKNAR